MRFQLVVSCIQDPCVNHHGAILSRGTLLLPVMDFETRSEGEAARSVLHADAHHRFDVLPLKENGWPLCPSCGDDELFTLVVQRGALVGQQAIDLWKAHCRSNIHGCYRCGTSHTKLMQALRRRDAEDAEEATRRAAGVAPDDTGPIVLPGDMRG